MSELGRSDPEYIEKALSQVFANDTSPVVVGINVGFAPETLVELTMLVDAVRDARCSVSRDIDEFVNMIAADPMPDEIVRVLPYDSKTGDLMFVLPDFING